MMDWSDFTRALPSLYGASLASEGPPKGQKYAFGTQKHPFREISRNYENRNSKIFGHESGARLSWASCTDLRSFGRLAAAVEPYPGWSVYEKYAGAGKVLRGNVFWRLRFFGLQVPRMRTAQYLRRALYPRNTLRVPVALFRVRRNLSILATLPVQK